jgi:Plasmid pRiA4b ORF-3-like protein
VTVCSPVSLHGAKPPIWRRLRLPASTTLAQLHQVIQVAFGWEDAHLHAFEVGGRRYSRPDFELWDQTADEGKARLRDLASRPGGRLRYTYDFGDSWEHDLLVEDTLAPDGVAHAACLGGRRAGPPEDCGGVWGYAELCDILADPNHPDHGERVDWLGHPHDPDAFDKDAINASLARVRLG